MFASDLFLLRRKIRKEIEPKIWKEFWEWLDTVGASDGSRLGRAVNYTLNQKPALMNNLENDLIPISNNFAENCARPYAVGRKNFLFHNCPEILFDMSKLTRQRDIDAFGINVSIQLVEVGRDAITLYIRLKEERYEALIRDLAVKLQETLDYCRDVAANRSDLRITQKTIFVHPCGRSGG